MFNLSSSSLIFYHFVKGNEGAMEGGILALRGVQEG